MRSRRALLPPVTYHAELGEGKGDEHVDAVKDNEEIHGGARGKQRDDRGGAHEENSVLRDESIAEGCEASWKPTVERHVGHHARTVEKAGLGRHQKKSGGGNHRGGGAG